MRTSLAITALLLLGLSLSAWQNFSAAIPQVPPGQHAPPPPETRVDINHASLEELLKVPGMTRTWAGRIVRFRPYRSKQDLVDRGVVSSAVYNRVKDYIIAHREKQ
jgi:DNA uptake protein ComE-like DNA-binding protein